MYAYTTPPQLMTEGLYSIENLMPMPSFALSIPYSFAIAILAGPYAADNTVAELLTLSRDIPGRQVLCMY